MEHNILSYWQSLQNLPLGHPDQPSPRVCRLMTDIFESWRTQSPFIAQDSMGHLFDRYTGSELDAVKKLPVPKRKALSIQLMLDFIAAPENAAQYGTFGIHVDELIVGRMPPYSVGQGKEIMLYLSEPETLEGQLSFINERSPFGHVIPDYSLVVNKGLNYLIERCKKNQMESTDEQKTFLQSVVTSLEGVKSFAEHYAQEAESLIDIHKGDTKVCENLEGIASRMRNVPAQPASTFIEAVQSIHIVHCALHWTGETSSLGRLDQILFPFYEKDIEEETLDPSKAQEIIDCFCLKLDEPVTLHNEHLEDHFTSSDGALMGTMGPSTFDQGALANQWMQQVTLGGVKANDEKEAIDATNHVTYIFLETARRLPLNAPTLDLRVHKATPNSLLELAARTQLSGGAHPVLLNDDKIIPNLLSKTGAKVDIRSARNYACDGCYETLFPGQSEFTFGFVPALDVLEKTLNSGAGFGAAGSSFLRGMKFGLRTKPANEILDFEMFWEILVKHTEMKCHEFINGLFISYGQKEKYCPSILLSAFIDGCVDNGRDLTGGSAKYKVIAPLMTGISTAADSLYVIKNYVFEQKLFSLEELVSCLRSNWGLNPNVIGMRLTPEKIERIKNICVAGEKFGTGKEAVDKLAYQLIDMFCDKLESVRESSWYADRIQILKLKYDNHFGPFEFAFTPGCGTFEQYVFGGGFAGASADGRHSGGALASDLSASPLHEWQDATYEDNKGVMRHAREISIIDGLRSFNNESINRLSDGAPMDINIREDFPLNILVEVLTEFSQGNGSNVMTVTAANPRTLSQASGEPDNFDLLRVRMGGWTEFYSVLFPSHKSQHQRRPLYVPSATMTINKGAKHGK